MGKTINGHCEPRSGVAIQKSQQSAMELPSTGSGNKPSVTELSVVVVTEPSGIGVTEPSGIEVTELSGIGVTEPVEVTFHPGLLRHCVPRNDGPLFKKINR